MIETLTYPDIGRWVECKIQGVKTTRGRIKAYDNSKKVAWIVYEANRDLEKAGDEWRSFVSTSTNYSDLTFFEHGNNAPA